MMKICTRSLAFLLLLAVAIVAEESPKDKAADSSKNSAVTDTTKAAVDRVIVYYLHGERRCPTCIKLEAYSQEAVDSGFAQQLKDSVVIWRVINFEEEGNEHFVKDYQLFSKSVILSRVRNGKETAWKNLDKIWELVGDKEKFIAYVQSELQSFLKPADK